ncbi:hypothetical protein B6U79_01370 [Candidatus Bathyarchaeota archaeon ex4484_231]|nr:MAG: hypothetical protein B6U79_01370 [Candidatus Bathyarchaeota archaeon ex4484_231]
MPEFEGKIQLRVEDIERDALAEGIARIDEESMKALGLSEGSFIEIIGKRTTAATAYLGEPKSEMKNMIRIDAYTRKNAGVSIGSLVEVAKAEVKSGEKIVLAPMGMQITVDKEFKRYVKNRLLSRAFTENDLVALKILGQPIHFVVVNTLPKGIVRLTNRTHLQILSKPLSLAEEEQVSANRLT